MASSIPFQITGTLTYPPDDGQPDATHSSSVSSSFTGESKFKYELSGSGSQVVDFGTIDTTGAKGILIEVASDAAAGVMVQFNGGGASGQVEVTPGGHISLGSPTATSSGVLSMTLVHTVDATVRVRLLG